MFQRQLLLVAGRLHNAPSERPQLSRRQEGPQDPAPPMLESLLEPHGNDAVDEERADAATEGTTSRAPVSSPSPRFQKIERRRCNLTMYLMLLLYLVAGILFYTLEPTNKMSGMLGFYQAISIGYSVGLSPKDPDYSPNPWFSSLYVLIGAVLISIILIEVGQQVEERASWNVFEAMKRWEDYEQEVSAQNPLLVRCRAFVWYNAAYLSVLFLWVAWLAFIVGWSMYSTSQREEEDERWTFGDAQYFAVSLCSSAGSFSLPPYSPDWAYLLAGISMLVGVPLMALAISAIVVMRWQGNKFRRVKAAAWSPVTPEEREGLDGLGLGEATDRIGDVMTKQAFVLLGLLRTGQDAGIVRYLADAYDEIERRGGIVLCREGGAGRENVLYSEQVRACFGRSGSFRDGVGAPGKGGVRAAGERWSVTATSDEDTPRRPSDAGAGGSQLEMESSWTESSSASAGTPAATGEE